MPPYAVHMRQTEVQAVDLLRVQQAVFGLRAFIVIEEIGPPHLRNFHVERKFWSTLSMVRAETKPGVKLRLARCGGPSLPRDVFQDRRTGPPRVLIA